MLAKLESIFGGWPIGEAAPQTFDKPQHEPTPGVYLVHKADVNQGRVSIGHRGIMRGTPDEFPLRVMNGILGGIGFQSRLVDHIRSDEGLAYSVGSRFGQGTYWPSDFRCYLQTKSDACPYAIRLVLDEIERIRTEEVGQEELSHAVAYFTESFPQYFESKMTLLGTYVSDEYTGRDSAYWQSYVDNLKKVTPADVLRVAETHLHPDQLVIVAVGDAEAIKVGGHDKAPDLRLDEFGAIQQMEPRDPDTLRR
jgi:predicted Zn-dependent peptidase